MTLIELLTVIAIIGVVAAIAFPVIAKAKESAKRAGDISNLQQLSQSVLLYSSDSDEMLPIYSEAAFNKTNGIPDDGDQVFRISRMWDVKVSPYVSRVSAQTDLRKATRSGVWHSPLAEENETKRSYGINQLLDFEWLPQDAEAFDVDKYRWRHISTNAFANPSSTILLGDAGREGRLSPPRNWDGWADKYIYKTLYFRRESPWRFGGSACYCMADGHAKFLPGDQLYPSPKVSPHLTHVFGLDHCSMVDWFLPLQSEKDWHTKIALSKYLTTCNAK